MRQLAVSVLQSALFEPAQLDPIDVDRARVVCGSSILLSFFSFSLELRPGQFPVGRN
jgi:hypothetical protein